MPFLLLTFSADIIIGQLNLPVVALFQPYYLVSCLFSYILELHPGYISTPWGVSVFPPPPPRAVPSSWAAPRLECGAAVHPPAR